MFLRLWNILVMISATSAALAIPVRLVFELKESAIYLHAHYWVIGFIFLLDIFVHILGPRSPKGEVFTDNRTRLSRYLKSWFIIDLIPAIPFAPIFGIPVLQALRILKLARVWQFLYQRRRRQIHHSTLLRLATFSFWLVLTAHWLSCGWLWLHTPLGQGSHWDQYLKALYWCITTLTTVGYGDITPKTNLQMVYTMVVMVLGVGVYGYVIGNLANMLANIDMARAHYLANMQKLATFLKYRHIPPVLQRRIYDYYSYLWEHRMGYDESAILSGLPPSLQAEVSLLLKREFIEKVPFLKGGSLELIRDISFQLRPVIFTPGTYIFRAGEIGRHMYFISRGTVEVISPDGKTILATLKDGDLFGEMALLFSQPRSASVRAMDYCDLYTLDKDTFREVLTHYPDFSRYIEDIAEKRRASDLNNSGDSP
ncbi:MAG: cyclic nucleotide-binding domain-containing protein [Deltaproteobacteria bacterium]|jgi:voltage-gated potassium channel